MNRGIVYVVGIGPGNIRDMTAAADKALEESRYIAGYSLYCDLIREHFSDKEYIETPMRGEEKRVRLAFEQAKSGKL